MLPSIAIVWCAWLALMGVDAARYQWSALPFWLQCVGVALMVLSYWMIMRVVRENTFLAPVVRIQSEREHRVIATGPYSIVRHPFYSALLIYLPASALVLGSWYGLVASVVLSAGFVLRTAMEDRELRRRLAGYTEYAARVHYLLIPFVW